MNNNAYLREDCPYYDIFPNGIVPIKNILVAGVAECEGDGPPQEVYMIDMDKLTSDQLSRILDRLTANCPQIRSAAHEEIRRRGLPLRAKYVRSTSSDVPFFL